MEYHWGWLIAVYLFLGGLGAGAYLISFAAEKGLLGDAQSLVRGGYMISAPTVALGAGLLIFDLGQGLHKPWLILGMFRNLNSVMTWGIYILSAFIGVALIRGYFAWKFEKAPKFLTYLGAILALATCAYTGILLGIVEAIPFWNFFLLPVIFVISALSTGLSLNTVLAHWLEKKELKEGTATQSHLLLISTELLLLAGFAGSFLSGVRGEVGRESINKLLFGSLALPFWIVLVGMGLIGPILYYVSRLRTSSHSISVGLPDFEYEALPIPAAAAMGEDNRRLGKHEHSRSRLVYLTDGAVLIGGLTLRCLVIFAAAPIWNGFLA